MPNGIRQRKLRPGFTLIELLVVIGIIVILLGILLPVVATMRKKAQQADTLAEVTKIATACQNYFQDFHSYPGPLPDSMIYGSNGQITQTATGISQGTPQVGTTAAPPLTIATSSENLVLGLCGGLLAPTATATTTFTFNATYIGKGPQSLNYLNPQQVAAYFDPTQLEISNDGNGTQESWTLTQGSSYKTPALGIPEIMDHFSNPHPLIYLRAVTGGTSICDVPRSATTPGSQYFTMQLAPYWRIYTSTTNLSSPTAPATTGNFSTPDGSTGIAMFPTAVSFFMNGTVNDGVTPRSKDSFILISAGYDGIYGTPDDVIFSN